MKLHVDRILWALRTLEGNAQVMADAAAQEWVAGLKQTASFLEERVAETIPSLSQLQDLEAKVSTLTQQLQDSDKARVGMQELLQKAHEHCSAATETVQVAAPDLAPLVTQVDQLVEDTAQIPEGLAEEVKAKITAIAAAVHALVGTPAQDSPQD